MKVILTMTHSPTRKRRFNTARVGRCEAKEALGAIFCAYGVLRFSQLRESSVVLEFLTDGRGKKMRAFWCTDESCYATCTVVPGSNLNLTLPKDVITAHLVEKQTSLRCRHVLYLHHEPTSPQAATQ